MWYVFTMAYYSAIKENNVISFAITFGNFLLVYFGSKDHMVGPPIFLHRTGFGPQSSLLVVPVLLGLWV
jgi:hypothetical protein